MVTNVSGSVGGTANSRLAMPRVATMAAEGLTNRDIAQALFVTPSTVEVHLSSVYRKLGVNARSQLPQALDAPVESGRAQPTALTVP